MNKRMLFASKTKENKDEWIEKLRNMIIED